MQICDPTVTHTVHPLGTGRYTFSSDHSAIFFDFPVPIFHKKEKRFRFESAWLNHDDYDSLVSNLWNASVSLNL